MASATWVAASLGARLPGKALIELVVRCRLRLGVDGAGPGALHLPQWRTAGRGDSGWGDRLAEGDEDVAHHCCLGDEGDDPQVGAAERAAEREDFMDAGEQQDPGAAGGAAVGRRVAPGHPDLRSAKKATLSLPLSASIRRASSGVATVSESSFRIVRIFAT